MTEAAEELKLEHQHRPVDAIKVDIADAFAHGEGVKARRRTMLAGINEEFDGVRDTLERLGEELRRAENALRVVRMEVPND